TVCVRSFPDFLLGLSQCLPGTTSPVVSIPGVPSQSTPLGNVPCSGTKASNVKGIGGTTQANANFQYQFRLNYINAFVQDDIKVTPRFTLNAGVRWEWDGYPTTANGVTSTFWPSLALASPTPGTGCVINGVLAGEGSPGTGCSFAGFVLPNNY